MPTVTRQIPRPLGITFLAVAIAFAYLFLSTASFAPAPFKLVFGLILLAIIGVAIYIVLTGKAPVSYRIE